MQVNMNVKRNRYEILCKTIASLVADESDEISNMANVAAALKEAFGFLWVGFYRVAGDSLALGPFQGPVACTRIPKGRGVCGTAWERAESIIVADVEKFPGHIACNALSRSEIVVPLFDGDTVTGVLDIDSERLNAFDDTDELYLSRIVGMMTNSMTTERLTMLRTRMKKAGFDAIAVTGNDPHLGVNGIEYPDYLEYFSGVGASAGFFVVTAEKSVLLVDSRYYVMAKEKLRDTETQVLLAPPNSSSPESKIMELTSPDAVVGFDARRMSATTFARMRDNLTPRTAKDAGRLFAGLGLAAPASDSAKVFLIDATVAGESRRDKLARLAAMSEKDEIRVVSALDDIAWLLNIRATTDGYCPVPVARMIIDYPQVRLFLSGKISAADAAALNSDGVEFYPHEEFEKYAASVVASRKVAVEPDKTDFGLFDILRRASLVLREETNVEATPAYMKAVKNETELAGFRKCMIAEGVALTRFIRWITDAMNSGGTNEMEAARRLEAFRREASPDYMCPSFGTIAAYGANAAMPHYRPSNDTCAEIRRDSFFLLDSGGQYATGTTDVTRTFHFGTPSREEREHYTLVLKGMIGLSAMVFPEGTCGTRLDVVARKPLWERGLNYLHGTGHGVGHILNVHEGPQSIRAEYNPVAIVPGMVLSNEPAVYMEGKYGIRIENLLACRNHTETEFGRFLSFETLTLCPIDTAPIIPEMMTDTELEFLDAYHQRVYSTLAPNLTDDEKIFLSANCFRLHGHRNNRTTKQS